MNKRILFFSSVKETSLFSTQKFYVYDKMILEDIGYNVKTTNKIKDFLNWNTYDISFIYFYKWGFFCALISKFLGKKIYFTGGIDDLDKAYASNRKYFIQKIFFKLCCSLANKCILVSKSDYENVKKIYKKIPSNIHISYHCLDVGKFVNDISPKKEDNFITIAWLGDLENAKRKGVDLSLKIFHSFISNYEEFNDYTFIIIGKKGSGSEYLLKICKELNIEKKVIFTDAISEDEKIDLLKRSRIYMQPSIYEGFGIAAIEALATKNIVLHSGKGGLLDSVGEHGVIVDIEKDITSQIHHLYNKIYSIDNNFLDQGQKYVASKFAYNNRKNDFDNLIK